MSGTCSNDDRRIQRHCGTAPRQIIELLARRGALAVGALVVTLEIPQPAVSKHLAVLRKVGIVTVTQQGQQRLYSLDAKELKPVHD